MFFYKVKSKALSTIAHTFLILLLSSCVYHDQVVAINQDTPKFEIKKHYNSSINLKILDLRSDKEFIGFKTPSSFWEFSEKQKNRHDDFSSFRYKAAYLNNDQDLALILQNQLSVTLINKGFKLKRFTPNQISVEIIELGFIPAMYRNVSYSTIKVKASSKNGNLEKVYNKKIISYKPMPSALILGPFDYELSNKYYNDVVNDCLNQTIQAIVSDDQLWNFLETVI